MFHRLVLFFLFLLSFSCLAQAEEFYYCHCEPGAKNGVPVYDQPGRQIPFMVLDCGTVVTFLEARNGYAKIVTPDKQTGFALLHFIRKQETVEPEKAATDQLQREVEQLRREVEELKAAKVSASAPSNTGKKSVAPAVTASQPVAQAPVAEARNAPIPEKAMPSSGPSLFSDKPMPGEIYAGYSLMRGPSEFGTIPLGINVSATGYVNRWLGIEGSFAWSRKSYDWALAAWDWWGNWVVGAGTITANMFTVGAGPKFAYRQGKANPFVHVLAGVTHASDGMDSVNAFTLTTGGGVDVEITRHFSIRAVQGDWLHMRNSGESTNFFRLSAGAIFRF